MGENLVAGTMMSKMNVILLASRFWVQWEVDNQWTSPPLKNVFGLGNRLAGLVQPINGQKVKGVGLENIEFGRIWISLVLAQSTNNKSPRVDLEGGGGVLFNLLLVVFIFNKRTVVPA